MTTDKCVCVCFAKRPKDASLCVCILFIGHLEYYHTCFFATYMIALPKLALCIVHGCNVHCQFG
jgi:hypothetical protein